MDAEELCLLGAEINITFTYRLSKAKERSVFSEFLVDLVRSPISLLRMLNDNIFMEKTSPRRGRLALTGPEGQIGKGVEVPGDLLGL